MLGDIREVVPCKFLQANASTPQLLLRGKNCIACGSPLLYGKQGRFNMGAKITQSPGLNFRKAYGARPGLNW